MAVTIRDIAEKLNLSKSTVSYALNGGPKPVSEKVRLQVLEAAKELGFHPNQVAQSLAKGRTRTIAFVPHQLEANALTSPFTQTILQTIYHRAHEQEMHVLLPSGYDPNRPVETRHHLFHAPVDAVIMLLAEQEQSVDDLKACACPIMLMCTPGVGEIPSVNADNYGGACLAIEHLLELGHRRIGMLHSSLYHDTRVRLQAFWDLAKQYNLEVDPRWVMSTGLTTHEGYESGQILLQQSTRPTAMFCVNDQVACGLMRAAYEAGLKLPADLSIVGFDCDLVGSTSMLPVTTVRQPIYEMTHIAFDGILDQLQGKPVIGQTLPTSLIVRATTTRPPKDL